MTQTACPSCGKMVAAESDVCRSCGHPLRPPVQNQPNPRGGAKSTPGWVIGCAIAAVLAFFGVAIIGMLAAIAIPAFVKARDNAHVSVCRSHMYQIDSAKEEAALDKKMTEGDIVSDEVVSQYMPGGMSARVCPKGGRYTINPIGQEPSCSIHGSMSQSATPRTRL